ncbi:hypothetical protein PV04_09666 [Phialophora macrospora]|uniref:Uncharacterized protein n=1 Tax=Phialophora macrospora TaxID=1851006 RepID=A0A0D2CHQ0_9EURO|nr:hypothetical protein PV04_09666 [Phialophora macrospora]
MSRRQITPTHLGGSSSGSNSQAQHPAPQQTHASTTRPSPIAPQQGQHEAPATTRPGRQIYPPVQPQAQQQQQQQHAPTPRLSDLEIPVRETAPTHPGDDDDEEDVNLDDLEEVNLNSPVATHQAPVATQQNHPPEPAHDWPQKSARPPPRQTGTLRGSGAPDLRRFNMPRDPPPPFTGTNDFVHDDVNDPHNQPPAFDNPHFFTPDQHLQAQHFQAQYELDENEPQPDESEQAARTAQEEADHEAAQHFAQGEGVPQAHIEGNFAGGGQAHVLAAGGLAHEVDGQGWHDADEGGQGDTGGWDDEDQGFQGGDDLEFAGHDDGTWQ